MCKSIIKKLGGGFIYGVKHPFEKDKITYDKRQADMNWSDFILDVLGMSAAQGTIQWAIGVAEFVAFLAMIGYIDSKVKTPLKVQMVVDKNEPEKK